jgi:hypothetical protein
MAHRAMEPLVVLYRVRRAAISVEKKEVFCPMCFLRNREKKNFVLNLVCQATETHKKEFIP